MEGCECKQTDPAGRNQLMGIAIRGTLSSSSPFVFAPLQSGTYQDLTLNTYCQVCPKMESGDLSLTLNQIGARRESEPGVLEDCSQSP